MHRCLNHLYSTFLNEIIYQHQYIFSQESKVLSIKKNVCIPSMYITPSTLSCRSVALRIFCCWHSPVCQQIFFGELHFCSYSTLYTSYVYIYYDSLEIWGRWYIVEDVYMVFILSLLIDKTSDSCCPLECIFRAIGSEN